MDCLTITATYRALRGAYDLHNPSITQAIGKIVKKFEETGMFINIERPVHYRFARFARSAENIAIVSESVAEEPNVSISRRSQELGQFYGTLWRILHLDLRLHLHKIHLTQQLNVVDTWNGCLNNRRWTAIFRTKFSSSMKHISHPMGVLI